MSTKDCSTCLNCCMDMDMDPYCAADEVLIRMEFGASLARKRPIECAGKTGEEYTLWQLDIRRKS